MSIHHTRAIVNACLDGQFKDVLTVTHPIFGVEVPARCPGVPDEVLDPRNTWTDKAAYDEQAQMLAAKFAENFEKYADEVRKKSNPPAPSPPDSPRGHHHALEHRA